MRRISPFLAILATALSLMGCELEPDDVPTNVSLTFGEGELTWGHANGMGRLVVPINLALECEGDRCLFGGFSIEVDPSLASVLSYLDNWRTITLDQNLGFSQGDQPPGQVVELSADRAYNGCNPSYKNVSPILLQVDVHPGVPDGMVTLTPSMASGIMRLSDGSCGGEQPLERESVTIALWFP